MGSDRSTGPAAPDRRGYWQYIIALLLLAGCAAIYLLTQTANYTFDAVSYANQIVVYTHTRDRHWLFHPHHLLFNITGYLLWKASQRLGYRGGPLPVLQDMNGALGALGVALFWLALRRVLTRSRSLAALFAVGLGVSFGYWTCATDARVNMPSLVLLIAAFAALAMAMQRPSVGRALAAGAVAGLAALFHESAGLFLLVGCVGMLLASFPEEPAKGQWRARWAALGSYVLAWGLVFVGTYLVVGTLLLHLTTFAAYRRWAAEYVELGWWWSLDITGNLPKDLHALRRALFVESAGMRLVFHGFPIGRALYDLAYAGWLVAVYFCAFAFVLLFKTHYRPYLIVALVWAVAYAAFFTFWNPDYFVFWVPAIEACAVLLAIGASHYRAGRRGVWWAVGIGIWIACFAVSNYLHGIQPAQSASSNHALAEALDMRAHTHPGDLVVLSGVPWDAEAEVYIPYFAQRDVFSLHTEMERHHEDKVATQGALAAQIAQTYAAGHAVYALDDIWHSRMARQLLAARHHLTDPDLAHFFASDNRTLAWTSPEGRPVWKLTPIP